MPISARIRIKPRTGGYALLEIMLAFSVAMIILVGMVSLGASTVRAVTVSRANAAAGRIAQREADRLKLLRDTSPSWSAFMLAVNPCISADASCYINDAVTGVTSNSGTITLGRDTITYYFKIPSSSSTRIDYQVQTDWTVGTAIKSYIIEGTLTNWEEQ